MRTPIRPAFAALALIFVSPLAAEARWPGKAPDPTKTNCPWWRPCGPGETFGGNRSVPQGAFGVDARPACQRHDDCYDNPCTNRKDCDRAFRDELMSLCPYSTHPRLCKHAARMAYLGVRIFGRNSKAK
jgi:hypothetical protein